MEIGGFSECDIKLSFITVFKFKNLSKTEWCYICVENVAAMSISTHRFPNHLNVRSVVTKFFIKKEEKRLFSMWHDEIFKFFF